MTSASGNTITIRRFEPGDEHAFRLLNEEWITRYFRLEEKDVKTLSHPETILEAGGQILFAIFDNKPVGCCALIPMQDGALELSKMAVTPSAQGQGIGKLLLARTIEEARHLGAGRLYLETNSSLHPAIHLYESLGFKHIPTDQIAPSPYERADIYMELML